MYLFIQFSSTLINNFTLRKDLICIVCSHFHTFTFCFEAFLSCLLSVFLFCFGGFPGRSIEGAISPAMTERPYWLSSLCQWRSFKVMMMSSPTSVCVPNCFWQSWHNSTVSPIHTGNEFGTQNTAGLVWFRLSVQMEKYIGKWWGGAQRMGRGEGCCFHSSKNTAVILNILTQDQKKDVSTILPSSGMTKQRQCAERVPARETPPCWKNDSDTKACNVITSSFREKQRQF